MVILRLSSNSLTQSNPPQKFRLGWNTFAELLHTLRIASMGISFILGSGHTSDICFCGSTRRLGILAAYLLAKSAWTKQKGKHRKNNWTSKKTRLHPNPPYQGARWTVRCRHRHARRRDSPLTLWSAMIHHTHTASEHIRKSVIATASRRGKNFSGTPAVVEQVTGTNRNRQHGNRNTKTGRLTLQYVPA